MDSKFGMEEDFDVSFVPSRKIDTEKLEIKGVCEVRHVRDNKLLSLDVGRNVITTAGKKHLVQMLIGELDNQFRFIGLGRGGAVGATINDVALGGSVWNADTHNGSNNGYYVHITDPTQGTEYAQKFVLVGDAQDAVSTVSPREIDGNTDPSAHTGINSSELILTTADVEVGSTNNRFYIDINASDTVSFTGDTVLWSATYKFAGVNASYGSDSVIINEAGIFNEPIHKTNTASSDEPVLLARRTFSDKPVKDADELTIKWKITIK